MAPTTLQPGRLHSRLIASPQATELYLTCVSPVGPAAGSPAPLAEALYAPVADALRAASARVLLERLFAPEAAMTAVLAGRAAAWAGLDDGVPPTLLASPPGALGPLAALQVHALWAPDARTRVLELAGQPRGRSIELNARQLIVFGGLAVGSAGPTRAGAQRPAGSCSPADEARQVFEAADQLLRAAGGEFRDIVRTWLWLADILAWYDQFNRVRGRFFAQRGLIAAGPGDGPPPPAGSPPPPGPPASTGIGVRPAGGARCAMDLLAIRGPGPPAAFFQADGRQDSPLRYGSAFSRAASAVMPAGAETLFISGSAAIDAAGASCHVGDAEGQIRMTLDNVRAVLDRHGCRDADVVQGIAYCKTPEVERLWRTRWASLLDDWPCITVQADVCRADLLFELELTAVRGAGRR